MLITGAIRQHFDYTAWASARLVKADPQQRESEMYGQLLAAIGGAKQRVWLSFGYFVPDPRTKQTIWQFHRFQFQSGQFSNIGLQIFRKIIAGHQLIPRGIRH